MNEKLKKRLLIPLHGDKYVLIKLSQLVYCEADGNYTYYYMSDGTRYISSKNLKITADLLKDEVFYRISRSLLINLNHVESYDKTNNVVLTGNISFPVSYRNQASFHKLLKRIHYTLC
ncbi:LytTR family DNA-binding domain-containing protein [uncultured Kordia sp.]|uniref:LytR/AlgR family response regulator transcription factor n=1 Tax=uncultured Kordia sp. TaxID=507699 RepID=UPI00262C875E|nr:LytTR family DNA-binding domain-containing protein [uncultured Kordia sp.]